MYARHHYTQMTIRQYSTSTTCCIRKDGVFSWSSSSFSASSCCSVNGWSWIWIFTTQYTLHTFTQYAQTHTHTQTLACIALLASIIIMIDDFYSKTSSRTHPLGSAQNASVGCLCTVSMCFDRRYLQIFDRKFNSNVLPWRSM